MKTRFYFLRELGLACLVLMAGALEGVGKEYQRVSFDQLAAMLYEPEPPEEGKKKTIRKEREYLEGFVPAEVLGLDGKAVEIPGYMLPTSIEGEKVREFLLMPDTDSCCYGVMPALNSFVFARAKKGVNLFDNVPVRIRGKLAVEEVWQGGFFSHLYFVEVEELAVGFGTTGVPAVIEP
ncbi:DUF3299 domain-containing protein [Pelagicoccus mobilis]|uniref:DUF3299 domain-containing protein n=1 Tax=Pelagicoccus mobilis TaxID=415221 RepID=A0A934S324_9BACT|nr:DUF3299 domain-containing protein [Pelagicoccus mobilis]MBK1880290.1 DUF3299 domain-containing protein [Pelagicoccus mobilis]